MPRHLLSARLALAYSALARLTFPRLTFNSLALGCLVLASLALSGCVQANVNLFGEPGKAYKEQVLDGKGGDKVLLLGVS
ncbi:MAG: hypothetical protein Q8S17_05795, partial [Humidesulfovibrio sp.]|nr:hypothetical protein [Humidesulfovibrio sp.]